MSDLYRGLKAEAWDLLRGDTSAWPDRGFYLDVIRESGQPVLDVGCGTGRLLLDYMRQGIDIDGVDNAPDMLNLCRQKAQGDRLTPALYQQEMTQIDLPRRYRTILVPSSSLQLLPEDAAAAVSRLRAHLEPGGVLVGSFMKLRRDGQPLSFDWITNGQAKRPDGGLIRHSMRGSFDPTTQIDSEEERFELIVDGSVTATEFHASTVREYSIEQAMALYEAAGLTKVHATDGFTHAPAHVDSHMWCVHGTRPE